MRKASQIAGVVVTFLDITERKQNEEEIRAGSRRREEFLAMLSHELRNPLSTVVNAAAVLHVRDIDAETRERASRIIDRQTKHMARLLDDLLDVSRITRGGIELEKSPVDLRDVIRIALETLEPVLSQRQAPVIMEVSESPLVVNGDSDRLQQVVVNLLSNATRYSPADRAVHLSAQEEGESIVIRVKDSGAGVPKEMLSQIFELFVQHRQGLERSKGGMGIGLTLVRTIVELHGGTVEALSDGPGTGSEFVVHLPRHAANVRRNANPNESPAQPCRILVVEDQQDAREMMCYLLNLRGHEVSQAADGQSAVESIASGRPDIVFVDIGLPILNGYEVAEKVRSNRDFDHIVLVALTGYGQQEDVQLAKSAGFNEHITKPADSIAIDNILSQWSSRRAS